MMDMSAKSTGEVVETAIVRHDSVMIKGDRPCIALALQSFCVPATANRVDLDQKYQ